MKNIVRIICAATMMMACLSSAAQTLQISADAMLKRRCAEKVKQMCDDIGYMANPQNNDNKRIFYRNAALNLFVGKGGKYEEDGRIREGVMMEVTSTNRSQKKSYLIKKY